MTSNATRYNSCPGGYCCVEDTFIDTFVYCKRIGDVNHHCSVKPDKAECACAFGLYCVPNLDVPTYTSVYGTCRKN
ncbi:hypothetical protein FSP39_024879 [Pinctada imbricata]|uniref:Uncharacterized protein n=1 Tax=Pinctada imbricata TaxID=66713 RepID=A0AA88YL29_PINIB|nr:hypothetical protein FSP39_024879 [Pinctada imbricata]